MPRLCEAPDHAHLKHPAYLKFGYYCVVQGNWNAWYFACADWLDVIREKITRGELPGWSIRRWKGGVR